MGSVHQAPVVQKLDSAIHGINHYPMDKTQGNQLRYPEDSYLSAGQGYPPFEQLGPGLCPTNGLTFAWVGYVTGQNYITLKFFNVG